MSKFQDVIEYFRSFQGEAPYVGIQSIFIRFRCCNLVKLCQFCDTMQSMLFKNPFYVSFKQVIQDLKNHNLFHLTFTGGEPTLPQYRLQIYDFLTYFLETDKTLYNACTFLLETNGLLLAEFLESLPEFIAQDQKLTIVWSPKFFNDHFLQKNIETLQTLQLRNYTNFIIKPVVYDKFQHYLDEFLLFLQKKQLNSKVYLMPEGRTNEELLENSHKAVLLAYKYQTHLSPRLHIHYELPYEVVVAKYVVAGGSTVSRGIKSLIENKIWTIDDVNKFLEKTTNLYLSSIGESLSKKQTFNKDRFVKQVVKSYQQTYNVPWFRNVGKVIDSGGYQISIGYIREEDIESFIDAYIELLLHPDVGGSCEYMLTLDIVADYPYIKTKESLDKLNRLALDKIIQHDTSYVYFVYHFVNPRLESFWWELLSDYFSFFQHYSVGGLVAFARHSDFPFNIYSLPLLKILQKKLEKQDFRPFCFHILGVSSFTDIFSFIVLEKYLRLVYDIEVSINYDSTRAVRETALAKRLQFFLMVV